MTYATDRQHAAEQPTANTPAYTPAPAPAETGDILTDMRALSDYFKSEIGKMPRDIRDIGELAKSTNAIRTRVDDYAVEISHMISRDVFSSDDDPADARLVGAFHEFNAAVVHLRNARMALLACLPSPEFERYFADRR